MRLRDEAVSITALPGARVATVVWVREGQRYLTAVVKATFSLVQGQRMAPAAPEPIRPEEQPGEPGAGLRSAGDLAPYLLQTDVCVVGHATIPAGRLSTTVRLTVQRGGATLVDAWREVAAPPRAGGGAVRVPIGGMGPLPRSAPVRQKLLGACDARRLLGSSLDVPRELDFRYFQAAPPEQQVPRLSGTEWISLAGVFVARPRLSTQLPEVQATATLHHRGSAAGQRIELVADTLHLDADQETCSILWRGNVPLAAGVPLDALRVIAGVELPGRPLARDAPPDAPAAQTLPLSGLSSPAPAALPFVAEDDEAHDSPFGTGTLNLGELARARTPATPFEATHPSDEEATDGAFGARTLNLEEAAAVSAALAAATPFVPPGAAPPGRPTAATPERPPAPAATLPLGDVAALRAALAGTLPFVGSGGLGAGAPRPPAPQERAADAADEEPPTARRPSLRTVQPLSLGRTGMTLSYRGGTPDEAGEARERPPAPIRRAAIDPEEQTSILEIDARPRATPTLPFSATRRARSTAPARDGDDATGVLDVVKLRSQAVPFADTSPAPENYPATDRVARVEALHFEAPPRTVAPALPPTAAPEPAEAAVRPADDRAEPRLALEIYAAIKRAMWSRPGASDGVLEARGLTMIAWLEQERLWGEALTQEASEGGCDLAVSLGEQLRLADG